MIRGAFEALVIGDPASSATDVGPVIDAEAKGALDAHLARCARPAARSGSASCRPAASAAPSSPRRSSRSLRSPT
jgi:delta 1-pyrroline-5-carboxylate dehydrogenase